MGFLCMTAKRNVYAYVCMCLLCYARAPVDIP